MLLFLREGKLRGGGGRGEENAILSKPLVGNFLVIRDYVTNKLFFILFVLKSKSFRDILR